MTQQEFNERTGIVVSAEEFDRIHDLYLAAGEMDKDEFCREFRAHGHNPLVAELFKTCQNLEEQRLEQVNKRKMLEDRCRTIAYRLLDWRDINTCFDVHWCATDLIGLRDTVRYKLEKGYPLGEEDRNYLLEELKQGRI